MIARRVVSLFLSLWALAANAAQPFKLADFETSTSYGVINDSKITSAAVIRISNALDGSQGLRFTAGLVGSEAGWAGVSIPVTPGSLSTGVDHIELDARSDERSRGIFVTLSENDGSRWNAFVGVTREWKHQSIPLFQFRWFSGPETRRRSHPRPAEIRSVELWVGNTFQGMNGFQLDNVFAIDRVPALSLKLREQGELNQQKNTTLTLQAFAGGTVAPFDGTVWLEVNDRADALLPGSIQMRNGRGEFQIFPRKAGPLQLHAYEPVSDNEMVTTLTVTPAELQVHLETIPFAGEQVMYVNEKLAPQLSLSGNAVPLSAHIEVTNHLGRRLFSSFFRLADLHTDRGQLMITEPGMMRVKVRAIAEPVSALPHVENNMPIRLWDVPSTASAIQLPAGVTTSSVMSAFQLTLEDVPSTATVLGEDRYPLLVLADTPREIYFNKWFFGLCGGALSHLEYDEFPTIGDKRLKWHRKLGCGWGRNDLWWHAIMPDKVSWAWQKSGDIIRRYRVNRLRLLAVLAYEAAWSKDKSPADEEARHDWEKFVRRLNQESNNMIYGYEVWNEPNHGFWKPAPDVYAYRELVKTTWNAVRTSGTQEVPGPRVVAGATAGFDPVFLGKLLDDGYDEYLDVLSCHPYPEARSKSPEENGLPEILDEAREMLRARKLKKELWITELGWPTGPAGVSDKEQANYFVRASTMALHKGFDKLFWFNLYDWGPGFKHDDFGALTGLLDYNYHPKLAASAYNIATYMLAVVNPREQTQQGKATIYSFDIERQSVKYEGRMHVAWTLSPGDEQDIEMPMVMNGGAFAIDYLGAEHQVQLVKTEYEDDKNSTATGASTLANADRSTSDSVAENMSMDDRPSTRTYRFHVTNEPLYIWDATLPRLVKKSK
ncbi:MAG: hypothetical protein ACR2IE_17580 [Candidatus Sumerlaeaceae bacterium]